MSTRVIHHGRVAFTNERKLQQRASVLAQRTQAGYKDREGHHIDTAPIADGSADSPFRAGFAYRDPDDDIIYRMVITLDVQGEGWGTVNFWIDRYGLDASEKDLRVEPGYAMKFIREWCARGWMDAAMEERVPVKRYRVRDERKIYKQLWDLYNQKNSLGPGTKTKIRHALKKLAPLFA